MMSDSQIREKELKILKVVGTFLENPVSMIELEELTGISKSSCQRYLNDVMIKELLGEDIYNQVQKQLRINRLVSQQKGGINSVNNNAPIRNEEGQFIGNVKR